MTHDDPRLRPEEPDEGEPLLPTDDQDTPAFATVRLVDVQRGLSEQETAWHPELAPGMKCPQCRAYVLKRHRSTVYCWFCRQRWWWKRPV